MVNKEINNVIDPSLLILTTTSCNKEDDNHLAIGKLMILRSVIKEL
jgi:hypothetical protein